jgi:cystathionine beta-lyase
MVSMYDDFDSLTLPDLRRRTGIKWRAVAPGVIPAWVADMDFPAAPVIRNALRDLISAGELGYPEWMDAATPLRGLFATRMADLHDWKPDADRVREFDDLIHGLRVVLDLGTQAGDAIAVHSPGYTPFMETLTFGGRTMLPIPMLDSDAGWTFDLERFERHLAASNCTTLLLVNPHNPTGRVFTAAELMGLADAAQRHDLLVICDEIHAELVYGPHRHIPFASLSADAASRTVTLSSATKAFNIAGTCVAVAHFGPDALLAELDSRPLGFVGARNLFGVAATMAAWIEGDDWLRELVAYLRGNRELVSAHLGEHAPEVGYHSPEATYLAWLDFRNTKLGPDPARFLESEAGVKLVDGSSTGPGGQGFARLNFATSRSVLEEILTRITGAL